MTTHTVAPSPTSPILSPGPVTLVQPRHKDKGSYVQRWKVLRDRNKSLPKLDFNAKATGIPKKYQAVSGLPTPVARSYTYDSIKLPSVSNVSVITGVSNKTAKSDGYRRRDVRERQGSIQVLIHYERWKLNTNQQRA